MQGVCRARRYSPCGLNCNMKRKTEDITYVCETDNEEPLSEHELDQIAKILAEWIYRYMNSKKKEIENDRK
jgi:hypothetical protein